MKKQIRNLLASDAGFTLVELMVSVAILLMATFIVAQGVPVAIRAYTAAVDRSNAEVLLGAAVGSLRDTLSVADPNTVSMSDESGLISFTSMETGRKITIVKSTTGNIGVVYKNETVNPYTEIAEDTIEEPIVPEALASGSRIGAKDTSLKLEFAEDGSITFADGVFTIKGLQVSRQASQSPLAELPESRDKSIQIATLESN